MNRRGINSNAAVWLLFLFLILTPFPICAQSASASFSGTVAGPLGEPVAKAKVSIKNLVTGKTFETQTDSKGQFSVMELPAGSYEVTTTADGFTRAVTGVNIAAGSPQTLAITLKVPSGPTAGPTLQDLGFSASQIQGNPQRQALLDKRSHMLQIHQKLGLVTAGALVAALIASGGAKGHRGLPGDPSGRNLHAALGATTAGLYLATAYFAIRAPKVQGVELKGPIRLHRALAYIHGPGMIATTILGIMAYNQLSKGERVHGIAKAHGPVAAITTAAFGAAILSVSIKF
jgi:Carboxypeptidase regulatory-like domain